MLSQTYLDNIGRAIFLCNAESLSNNIAQKFYQWKLSQEYYDIIEQDLLYAMVSGASKAQIKTLCSVARVAPNNIERKKNSVQCYLNTDGTTLHK